MAQKKKLLRLDLQLFADGGNGGTATDAGTGVNAGAAGPQQGANANPLDSVLYGKQAEGVARDATVQETDDSGNTTTTQDRQTAYDEFIKANKDLDDVRVQSMIQKRLAKVKGIADKYAALAPTLEMLGKKYGADPNDPEALRKAIENDNSFYEEEAARRGISVEEVKEIRQMERENENLKRQMNELRAKQNADALYQKWLQQAEQVKQIYPSFDLRAELENPVFLDLLKSPSIDVRTAFEAVHHDDVVAGAMQFTAKTMEKKLANKIMANGARPTENGLSSQSAAVVKSDVASLTKEDVNEIIRRVRQGEKISFG